MPRAPSEGFGNGGAGYQSVWPDDRISGLDSVITQTRWAAAA
jgi:hypothetical protein